MSRDWDDHFLAKARLNATMSTCMTRHVGAVAVIDRRMIADGFNGNLPGAVHCDEGGCERCQNRAFAGENIDRCVCAHAEANLVAWLAKTRGGLDGATVYCTTQPCAECTKLLILGGVVEIVYEEPYAEGQKMIEALGVVNVKIRRRSDA